MSKESEKNTYQFPSLESPAVVKSLSLDESLPQFLHRLRGQELKDFQWMWPANLIEELDRPLSRGSHSTNHHEVTQGILEIMVVRHESWRKKLFGSPMSRWDHCRGGHGGLAGGRPEVCEG